MAAALLRKSSSLSCASARTARTAVVHQNSEPRLHHVEQASELAALPGSTHLGFPSRHPSRGLLSRSLWTASVRFLQKEDVGGDGFSVSGSAASPASISLEDFRSLIGRKKSEVAVLETAIDILETAPRDKGFEDLVRKHNLQIEPKKTVSADLLEKTVVGSSGGRDSIFQRSAGPTGGRDSSLKAPDPIYRRSGGSTGGGDLPLKSTDTTRTSAGPTARIPLKSADEIFKKPQSSPPRSAGEPLKSLDEILAKYSGEPFKAGDPIFQRRPPTGATAEPVKTSESTLNPLDIPDSGLDLLPPTQIFGKLNLNDYSASQGSSRNRMQTSGRRSMDSMSARRNGISHRVVPPPSDPAKPNAGAFDVKTTVPSKSTNEERKPGAWRCPECTVFNLAGDNVCYKCRAQRGNATERQSAMV